MKNSGNEAAETESLTARQNPSSVLTWHSELQYQAAWQPEHRNEASRLQTEQQFTPSSSILAPFASSRWDIRGPTLGGSNPWSEVPGCMFDLLCSLPPCAKAASSRLRCHWESRSSTPLPGVFRTSSFSLVWFILTSWTSLAFSRNCELVRWLLGLDKWGSFLSESNALGPKCFECCKATVEEIGGSASFSLLTLSNSSRSAPWLNGGSDECRIACDSSSLYLRFCSSAIRCSMNNTRSRSLILFSLALKTSMRSRSILIWCSLLNTSGLTLSLSSAWSSLLLASICSKLNRCLSLSRSRSISWPTGETKNGVS